jgi:hypothetical protein
MLKTFVVWTIACAAIIASMAVMLNGNFDPDLPHFADGYPTQIIGWEDLAR